MITAGQSIDTGYLHFTKEVKLSSVFTEPQCKVSGTKGFTQMKNPLNLPKHACNKYHLHDGFKRIRIILQEKFWSFWQNSEPLQD